MTVRTIRNKDLIEKEKQFEEYVKDCIERKMGEQIVSTEFYNSYLKWAEENSKEIMSQTKFGLLMTKKYIKIRTGTGMRYLDIVFKN